LRISSVQHLFIWHPAFAKNLYIDRKNGKKSALLKRIGFLSLSQYFLGSVSAAAIVGIIGADFDVFYTARRKGAKLTLNNAKS